MWECMMFVLTPKLHIEFSSCYFLLIYWHFHLFKHLVFAIQSKFEESMIQLILNKKGEKDDVMSVLCTFIEH